MSHPYDNIVGHLKAAFEEMEKLGIRDAVAKGGVGEILLAHYLGHQIADSDKGYDGIAEGKLYEYKVSTTDQFNFHFGTREVKDEPETKVRRHFQNIEGAYCAKRLGHSFSEIVFIPSGSLVNALVVHFKSSKGSQLNKNYRLESLKKLDGAKLLPNKSMQRTP